MNPKETLSCPSPCSPLLADSLTHSKCCIIAIASPNQEKHQFATLHEVSKNTLKQLEIRTGAGFFSVQFRSSGLKRGQNKAIPSWFPFCFWPLKKWPFFPSISPVSPDSEGKNKGAHPYTLNLSKPASISLYLFQWNSESFHCCCSFCLKHCLDRVCLKRCVICRKRKIVLPQVVLLVLSPYILSSFYILPKPHHSKNGRKTHKMVWCVKLFPSIRNPTTPTCFRLSRPKQFLIFTLRKTFCRYGSKYWHCSLWISNCNWKRTHNHWFSSKWYTFSSFDK